MIADADVRLATPADAAGIARLSRDAIERGLPWRWRPQRVARAIADPDTNVAVVADASGIVAFGIMSYRDDEAHLLLFAVRGDRRRGGVGSAVLRWLEACAAAAGVRRIRLEARRDNAAARCFYNEHGYHERVFAHAMYPGSVDGVRLEKWLRSAGW